MNVSYRELSYGHFKLVFASSRAEALNRVHSLSMVYWKPDWGKNQKWTSGKRHYLYRWLLNLICTRIIWGLSIHHSLLDTTPTVWFHRSGVRPELVSLKAQAMLMLLARDCTLRTTGLYSEKYQPRYSNTRQTLHPDFGGGEVGEEKYRNKICDQKYSDFLLM